jgi:LL-diaminopimelate aminotransferase
MRIADRLQHTEEYYFSKKLSQIAELNSQGKDIINLGIGSPDLMPPANVIERLVEEVKKPTGHGYQKYNGIPPLRAAIAKWYHNRYGVGLDAEKEILPLMGSKEGIMHVCMTYLQSGDEALIPNPGYPTYRSAVQLSGATAVPYELSEENHWLPDLEILETQDLSRVKLMWINYPNMPTGARPSLSLFEKLVQFGRKHSILICHDNPYSFILNEKQISILNAEGAKDVCIELNSFSKTFNMAGWRMGMLLGAPERISEILRFKSNMDSGMFYPLQVAAIEALNQGEQWHSEMNEVYRQRRLIAADLLDQLGCSFDDSQTGMFLWARIPAGYSDGYALTDWALDQARVFITPGGIFGSQGNSYIRISLCSSEDILRQALERIKTALETRQ